MDINLTTMQVLALSVTGMCHALLGSIKVPLARQLNINEARMGGLVSVFGFTLIPMAFAAGVFADKFGPQSVVAGGLVLLILSVIVLAHLKSYRMAVVSVLLLGTGWSAAVNVLNATQGPAFLPLDEIATRLSFAMNLGDFVFGMGAFLMPIGIAYCLRRLGLRRTFLTFAGLIALPLVLTFAVDWGRIAPPAAATSDLTFADLMSDKLVLVCCFAFFFHVPVEASVAAWATTLMMDSGASEKRASYMLSAFWLSFTVSRLIAALGIPVGTDHTVLIGMAVALVVVLLSLMRSTTERMTGLLVVTAGLILGPIFPILIAQLVGHVDPTLTGRAIGLFFCIGGIGWAVIPLLVGRMASRSSVKKSFSLIAICASCLLVLTIVLSQLESSTAEKKDEAPAKPLKQAQVTTPMTPAVRIDGNWTRSVEEREQRSNEDRG